jgi:hypothetical protein
MYHQFPVDVKVGSCCFSDRFGSFAEMEFGGFWVKFISSFLIVFV